MQMVGRQNWVNPRVHVLATIVPNRNHPCMLLTTHSRALSHLQMLLALILKRNFSLLVALELHLSRTLPLAPNQRPRQIRTIVSYDMRLVRLVVSYLPPLIFYHMVVPNLAGQALQAIQFTTKSWELPPTRDCSPLGDVLPPHLFQQLPFLVPRPEPERR